MFWARCRQLLLSLALEFVASKPCSRQISSKYLAGLKFSSRAGHYFEGYCSRKKPRILLISCELFVGCNHLQPVAEIISLDEQTVCAEAMPAVMCSAG